MIEREPQPAGGVEIGLVRSDEGFARGLSGSWRPAEEQVPGGANGPIRIDPVLGHPLAQLEQRLALMFRLDDLERDDGARMVRPRLALDDHGPMDLIEGHQLARRPLTRARPRSRRLAGRIMERPAPEVDLLVREAVAPDLQAFRGGADASLRLEQADRPVVLDQLIRGLVHAAMEVPPGDLLLAPMPADELGEQPGGRLFGRALGRVDGDARRVGQAGDQRLGPRAGLRVVGRQVRCARAGPWHVLPGQRRQSAPQSLEPIAQALVADDVVLVVALDAVELARVRPLAVAELEPRLERDDAGARVAQVDLAGEAVERFELLDRVALDRRPQPLAHGPEQVHEDAAPKQAVDLVLAHAVAAHEPLECRRFVRGVVVDVERRIRREPLGEEGHQPLERRPFAGERELAPLVA